MSGWIFELVSHASTLDKNSSSNLIGRHPDLREYGFYNLDDSSSTLAGS
ncbi:Protein of unknown function [Pyronema omphalodes CBS 100304]|uniref:Uncharacterized protein n=1 Tax=Pyronema omphalodes (strain CBS 100304) TaxID=1076935 RepID=U4LW20_PYROM|nr:Protein of unknown function [Pyronema omphalodes CBS 100304]